HATSSLRELGLTGPNTPEGIVHDLAAGFNGVGRGSGCAAARTATAGPLFLLKRKLQISFVGIHPVHNHPDPIADGNLAPGPLAGNLADVLLEGVLIAGKDVDRNEPFDEQVSEFHEESILRRADDETVENLA